MRSKILVLTKNAKLKTHQKPLKKFTKSFMSLRTGFRRSNTSHLNTLKGKQNSLKGKHVMEAIHCGYRELLINEVLKKKIIIRHKKSNSNLFPTANERPVKRKIIQNKKSNSNLFPTAKERPVKRKIAASNEKVPFKRVSW